MRRSHWWGAAASAGVLVSVAFVAPAAVAAPAAPASPAAAVAVHAAPKPNSESAKSRVMKAKTVRATHRRAGRYEYLHHPYPPHKTPSVSISGPPHGHPGRVITVTSTITINNTAMGGVAAALYASKNGTDWKQISATTTKGDGTASFTYYFRTKTLFRVVVAGRHGVAPGQSSVITVSPR